MLWPSLFRGDFSSSSFRGSFRGFELPKMLAAATLLTYVAPRIVVAPAGLEFYLVRKMFSFAAFSKTRFV